MDIIKDFFELPPSIFVLILILLAGALIFYYTFKVSPSLPEDFDNGDKNNYLSEDEEEIDENYYCPIYPFQVTVKNPTDKELNCVLFGYNHNINTPNFGSDVGIEVKNSFSTSTYSGLLCQSAFEPFEIVKTRIQSTNLSQVEKLLP